MSRKAFKAAAGRGVREGLLSNENEWGSVGTFRHCRRRSTPVVGCYVRGPHGPSLACKKIADDLLAWRERWGTSYCVVQDGVADDLIPLVAKLAGC